MSTITISYAGETVQATDATCFQVCDALIAKHGAGHGVPQIERAAYSTWSNTVVDDAARARIEAQQAALGAAGVKVDASQQFFATGTRMAREGYETQRQRKAEHDAKLSLRDAVDALRAEVEAEGREDVELSAGEVASAIDVSGTKVTLGGLRLTEQAVRGLASRLDSPMLGYVIGLRDRIQAEARGQRRVDLMRADLAEIAEVLRHECRRAPDAALKIRTRKQRGDVFAVVSPAYTPADAPAVLALLEQEMAATAPDARGSYSYDHDTTDWEIRLGVWTPTPVEEQAVGEAFEGYVSIAARDNGTRRITGGGGISLLRCLNASTYVAEGARVSRTHRGEVSLDVQTLFRAAAQSITALCGAWGQAREQVIEVPAGLTIEDAIPGFWRHLLRDRTSELAGVLPGRTETNVEALTAAFFGERRDENRLVRADFAQGWTRAIQALPSDRRRNAETAIAGWVVGGRAPKFEAAAA